MTARTSIMRLFGGNGLVRFAFPSEFGGTIRSMGPLAARCLFYRCNRILPKTAIFRRTCRATQFQRAPTCTDNDLKPRGAAPHELRIHYEDLPQHLTDEGIEPAVPWPCNYRLDFRLR